MEILVTVQNTTKEAFEAAMRLVFLDQGYYDSGDYSKQVFNCTGYKIEDGVLYLSRYSEKCTLFPYKYNIQQTIDFAWGWWENNKTPKEHEPDTDGSTAEAWRLTTKGCGVGSNDWGMFVCIKPIWFVYGK